MITTKYTRNLKPEGDYEVLISKVHIDVAKSGTEYISIPMTIRKDVDQPYQNAKIFYSLWKRKEPSALDMEVEGYSFDQLMRVCEAVGIPAGTSFEGLEDILNQISWKQVICHLRHNEYNGQKQEQVHYLKKTEHPTSVQAPVYAEPAAELEDDGDLPF